MRDIIIIGAGPAGMAAAIYAARKKLDTALISMETGGQALWSLQIENYLGYRLISGMDLTTKFEEHVRDFGVMIEIDKVTSVELQGNTFLTKTGSGKGYESRAVIVCSGRSARNLGVPGEEEFKGRGVAYCATCDAPLFAGENVAVVGGGNAGLTAAIQLTRIAKQVYLIESLPELQGDPPFKEHLYGAPNVRILTSTRVERICGEKSVNSILVKNTETGKEETIPLAGIFVEIGFAPNTGFLPRELKINNRSEIEIDCNNRTSIPGLFAAGDATNIPHKQIMIAAGEGAKALLTAYDYLISTFPGIRQPRGEEVAAKK